MKTLQISHGYNAPFLGVSMHYANMFATQGGVTTVYLSGEKSDAVRKRTGGNVLFWEQTPKGMKGLKIGLIWKLYRLIRDEKFDVVLCHRYKSIYLALICQLLGLNFKQVGVIHAFGDFQRSTRRWFLSFFKRKLLVLGVSNSVRDDIRHSMPAFPVDRIQTLYNAIQVDLVRSRQFGRKEARVKLGLNEAKLIVGNVGRLHPDKDQATLIRAFSKVHKEVPDSQLVIIGTGRLEKPLKNLVAKMDLVEHVLFLGEVNDAVNYYKAFDMFVLTSDKEPFGLVLLEAMAAKVPVIASNCGGAIEIVGGVGRLFEFGDDNALAKEMLSSDNMKTEEVELAYEKVRQRFSFEATRAVLVGLLASEK